MKRRVLHMPVYVGGMVMRARIFVVTILAAGLLLHMAGLAHAFPPPPPPPHGAPELDLNTLRSGLALLGGGVLLLAERFRRNRKDG